MMRNIFLILALLCAVGARATVSSQTVSVSFTCTGGTVFPFTFPISDATALSVIKAGTTLASTAYTVKPVNNNYANGGNVTLGSACASGTLVIQRATPLTQASIFTDNMPIPYKTFERSLDKLTEIDQETVQTTAAAIAQVSQQTAAAIANISTIGNPWIYGLGNGLTVIDASTLIGANLGAQVIAAILTCPAAGCVVTTQGIYTNLAITSSITLASPGGGPVHVIWPIGTIARTCGMQIIPVNGSSMEGQGKSLTNIQSSGCTDSAVGYAGWAYLTNFTVRNMTVQNGGSGSNLTAVAFDLPGLQTAHFENVAGIADGIGLRIGGLRTGGCDCYNKFYDTDFRANGSLSLSFGVDLEGYANSNSFFGGTYWGDTGIGNGGWGNFFYGPDIESSTTPVITQSAVGTGGNGLQIFGGYGEANGLAVLTASSTGNYWTGQFTMGVSDSSREGCLNFFSQPGSYATDGVNPNCLGVSDRLQFGSGTNGYNNYYYIQGLRAGSWGLASYFDQVANRLGYTGHANHLMGFLNTKGITTNGSVNVNALGTPPAPVLTVVGSTHTAACPSYYAVGIDWNGHKTLPSAAGTLAGNVCPNTLSGTNYIEVTPTLDGVWKWDILKGSTATSIFTNHLCGGAAGSGTDCPDTGQATTGYTPPTRDATGDISLNGALTNHIITQTAVPNVSGTGCSLTSGNDINGTVAATGADACVVTFAAAYTAPVCQLTPSAVTVLPNVTGLATTYLHFSTAAAGTVYYHCEDVQ